MLEEVVLGAKASDRVEMVVGLVEPALEPMFGRELMTGIGGSMEMPGEVKILRLLVLDLEVAAPNPRKMIGDHMSTVGSPLSADGDMLGLAPRPTPGIGLQVNILQPGTLMVVVRE